MTNEEEIIADFVGEKKIKPPAKKLIIEEKDFSDPGMQVYWVENVGARYRVMGAKIVPVPQSAVQAGGSRAPVVPGLKKELIISDSMSSLEKFIASIGKNAPDFILYFDSTGKYLYRSGYVYATKVDDVTELALHYFITSMIEEAKKEGDDERTKAETTSIQS